MGHATVITVSLVLCAAAIQFTSAQLMSSSMDQCMSLMGGHNVTVLMIADPGSFTGTAEAKYYIENLENATYVPGGSTMCVNRAYGTIMGQNVTVISSGINAQASAICTQEVLQCAGLIKEMIFSGTAGFSPAMGGFLNPPECDTMPDASNLVRIGDVCVSPFNNNWECRLASWSQQCGGYPNQCSAPMAVDNLTASGLYGQCSFNSYDEASVELSNELISANQRFASHNSLTLNAALKTYEQEYWAAMSNGTGVNYETSYNSLGGPTVYNYTMCTETDGQFFWSGAPWDFNARTYVAYTLNEALNSSLAASDVVAVSAMEAVGVALAMTRYAATEGAIDIPYTFVRGASDYTHLPLMMDPDGTFSEIDTVPQVDFINGYSWAIASYSAVVLDLFTARCMDANGGDQSQCQMIAGGVTYSSS